MYHHPHVHGDKEMHLGVDRLSTTSRSSAMDPEEEENSFSKSSGMTGAMFGKMLLLPSNENTQSQHTDDASSSLGSEQLLGLKGSSGHIDKFVWFRKLLLLCLIFTISFSFVFFLFMSLPKLHGLTSKRSNFGEDEIQSLHTSQEAHGDNGGGGGEVDHSQHQLELAFKLPKNITELQAVRETLLIYQQEHQIQVQISIICVYIFLQAFIIPGSIFLNILAGSLYGFYKALILVLVLATIGSAVCYMLSYLILKEIIYYYFPERCVWLAQEVHHHRHNLLNYILFLRITPIFPNWFINVSAPIVSVPLQQFVLGTFIGEIPASIVAVKAGCILSQLNSVADLYDLETVLTISVIAILALVPVVFKRRIEEHMQGLTLIKTT
ncbi:hypothetical protein BDL97_12G017500 [Sphagnum fallax]|nr:hypothetical protein BDL97_12G017500 [Sphagnum fallax]KAH8945021.1 hypothetical protein BDL97_12G017500 [Sphagnum fallax]KAH8945022.1 hypothetical protein BDL97_12G017500 [Sphagnum fallax]KAH8945023.1 hypothetical protein BDL97_12G017500 [Sphagnum fallax]KAH8945024.1 hypothetical protein BDL97_12G017500 [Sphagnum fallax]